jgi:hypothetical protein
MILTIRKPDLIGNTRWQFSHGNTNVSASIEDDRWLERFHEGRIPLRSGDALRCRVRFTYIFDEKGKMTEQRNTILKVMKVIRGPGHQTSFLDDE